MALNWLPTVGSILGSIGQGIFSAHSAEKAFNRQKELWEYMQSNAHQLEVEDLKKAGLNPILSATNSQLAGMPSVQQERVPDNDLGMALNSALSASIADKQANINYDLGLKQLKQRDRELDIMEQNSAANVANLEAQREEALERIVKIRKENEWIDKIKQAELDEKNSVISHFFAQANKAIVETGLTRLQQEKLESQLKYGEILCKYVSPRLASKILSRIEDVVDRTDFNDFMNNFDSSDNPRKVALDYIDDLVKRGVLID